MVCQNEGCQKAKNKYRILMHVCGIDKDGTDEPIYRNRMKTWRTDLWTQLGKGRVG